MKAGWRINSQGCRVDLDTISAAVWSRLLIFLLVVVARQRKCHVRRGHGSFPDTVKPLQRVWAASMHLQFRGLEHHGELVSGNTVIAGR